MTGKEYLEQLAQTAGLTEEQKAGILKVATENEKFVKGLEEGVMLRSDYSRAQDALTKDKQKWSDHYQATLQWKAQEEQRLADLDAQVKAYEAAYGKDPDNGGEGKGKLMTTVQGDFVSKKDWEAEMAKRDQQYVSLLKDGMALTSRH